jgi:large repetitive protein
LAAAAAWVLLLAPPASATFHLIKIREVHPSGGQDSYVELQMYAGSQTFLSGHAVTVYNATGALVHSSSFSSGVANGQNQATVLIGDSGVQSSFGVAPDLLDSNLALPSSGGAVCWNSGGLPADCVAWGNFSGGAALHTATGATVGSSASPGGVSAGKAIRRSIQPGCPTLLEEADDSDDSATDFSEVAPAPRNNASAISETTCAGAPNTTIDDRPLPVTNSTSAGFTYEAPTATSYECRLGAAAFASCPATGIEYTALADGSYTFQVRGRNASGPDPTPAGYSWRVDTAPPTASIDQKPADPSAGGSVTFTYHSSETNSKFQCSLAPEGQPDAFSSCSATKTFTGLADGNYTFKVTATDAAGNQQTTPTAYSWTVDNSLADTTPPQTSIESHPADPSASSDDSFTYTSNEAPSTFECAFDGAVFSPCPAGGITYSGLGSGPHSFQVRAIDASANVDPTPAGFSFQVVLAPVQLSPPPAPITPLAAPQSPQTLLAGKPGAKTRDRTPTFRFRSDIAGAKFQCALDRGPFKGCRSPFTTKPLKPGLHKFSVRSVAAGTADATPASFKFKVLGGKR